MYEANANPEKRFFIELLTRDISLEDAILDLIDNSIDSLVRFKNIDLYSDFVTNDVDQDSALFEIKIVITPNKFLIEDNCGGIHFEDAENGIFRFGNPDPNKRMSLSVFGIGMKRAIFKIGNEIEISSRSMESGFSMDLETNTWMSEQETEWKIPIDKIKGASSEGGAGTKIAIKKLNDSVVLMVKNPSFINRLFRKIQSAYPFYLDKYVTISINNEKIPGKDLTFSQSHNIEPFIESWVENNVQITLMCGFLPKDKEKWKTENSGWYIVCNGRVVVHADRSTLTGWGHKRVLPQFNPKNRGFLGIIFFSSSTPEELPWNTTKRGINEESEVFLKTRVKMIQASKPIIQFQNKMYESQGTDDVKVEYRESIKQMSSISATKKAAERASAPIPVPLQMHVLPKPEPKPKQSSIQYKVKKEDLKRVKKSLGRLSMANYEVGKRTFKYYFDRECS